MATEGEVNMRILIAAGSLLVALGMALNISMPARAGSIGGPVILGGDDLTSHGGATGGVNEDGWLYMQRALENIEPNVTRSNDSSVAALGSSATGGGAGDAILSAATAAGGLTVTYYEGGPAITGFFAALASGSTNPAIIWIAGNDASNDLGNDPTESAALAANANGISAFVNSGGGLMSHGIDYGWLTALLPTLLALDDNSSDGDLYFTPEGLADLSPLTVANINAGPWHNYFEGDLGGLSVLVRSADIQDINGNDAAVIIGGATVSITDEVGSPDEPEEEEEAPNCIPGIPGFSCGGQRGGGVSDATAVPQPTVVAQPTQSAAPPTPAPTQPSGTIAGRISAPDTGTGPESGDRSATLMLIALTFVLAAGALATGIVRRR